MNNSDLKKEQISKENSNNQFKEKIDVLTKERDELNEKLSDKEKNFKEMNHRLISVLQENEQVKKKILIIKMTKRSLFISCRVKIFQKII